METHSSVDIDNRSKDKLSFDSHDFSLGLNLSLMTGEISLSLW